MMSIQTNLAKSSLNSEKSSLKVVLICVNQAIISSWSDNKKLLETRITSWFQLLRDARVGDLA